MIRFWQYPVERNDFDSALKAFEYSLEELTTGVNPATPREAGQEESITIALVGTVHLPAEEISTHYHKTISLLRNAINSLRVETLARIPNFSIEGVWPLYFRIFEEEVGKYDPKHIIPVEHGLIVDKPASAEQLNSALVVLTLACHEDPVVMYRDFQLSAYNAAKVDGDYVECVLKASIAAEVLIKQVSWMLVWEDARKDWTDERYLPLLQSSDTYGLKPSALIGGVLAKKLGGNWNSKERVHAVGAWKSDIVDLRNRTIHGGYHPSEAEVDATLSALTSLHLHVFNQVKRNAAKYPHTAGLLFGSPYTKTFAEHVELLYEYHAWLKWLFEVKFQEMRPKSGKNRGSFRHSSRTTTRIRLRRNGSN